MALGALATAIGFLLLPTVGQAGSSPALAFSPSSYSYGTVDAGAGATGSKTFVLRNSGGSATGMLTVSLTGSSDFTITANGCAGTSLGPKKSCSVTVHYVPTANGASDSATLTATSKKPAATASASLTGASGAPDLSLSPGTFSGTNEGEGKEYQYQGSLGGDWSATFTVTNNGTGSTEALDVNGGNTSNGFALTNDTCTGTALAPNGTCTFDLTFTSDPTCGVSGGSTDVDIHDAANLPYIHLVARGDCPA